MGVLQFFPLSYAQCRFFLYKPYEIVVLAKNKYSSRFSSNKIAKIVNCNHKTATKLLNRCNETKDHVDCIRSGALRTTAVQQDQMMVNMALK